MQNDSVGIVPEGGVTCGVCGWHGAVTDANGVAIFDCPRCKTVLHAPPQPKLNTRAELMEVYHIVVILLLGGGLIALGFGWCYGNIIFVNAGGFIAVVGAILIPKK